jgi:hypothetical protein
MLGLRLRLARLLALALDGRHFKGKGRLLDLVCPASGTATRMLFGRQVALDLSSGSVGAIRRELNDYWLSRVGSSAQELYERLTRLGFRYSAPQLPMRWFETRLFIHGPEGRG